jgi:hypothetical protein
MSLRKENTFVFGIIHPIHSNMLLILYVLLYIIYMYMCVLTFDHKMFLYKVECCFHNEVKTENEIQDTKL